jgi:thioredoxin 1
MRVLSNNDELTSLIQGSALVMIKATASWCGPCRKITPAILALEERFGARVTFAEFDVDNAEDIAKFLQVEGMPSFFFFQGGALHRKIVGAREADVRGALEEMTAA